MAWRLRPPTFAHRDALDAAGGGPRDPVDLGVVGRRQRTESQAVVRIEHAVEHERVEVDVEVDRAAEALDERDRPALRGAGRVSRAGAAAQAREHPPDEHAADFARQAGVVRQAVLAAAVAVHPQEAVREDAALEEPPELPLDERGRRAAPRAGAVEERLETIGDDLVDDRPVRSASGVGGRGAASGSIGGRTGRLPERMESEPAGASARRRSGCPGGTGERQESTARVDRLTPPFPANGQPPEAGSVTHTTPRKSPAAKPVALSSGYASRIAVSTDAGRSVPWHVRHGGATYSGSTQP